MKLKIKTIFLFIVSLELCFCNVVNASTDVCETKKESLVLYNECSYKLSGWYDYGQYYEDYKIAYTELKDEDGINFELKTLLPDSFSESYKDFIPSDIEAIGYNSEYPLGTNARDEEKLKDLNLLIYNYKKNPYTSFNSNLADPETSSSFVKASSNYKSCPKFMRVSKSNVTFSNEVSKPSKDGYIAIYILSKESPVIVDYYTDYKIDTSGYTKSDLSRHDEDKVILTVNAKDKKMYGTFNGNTNEIGYLDFASLKDIALGNDVRYFYEENNVLYFKIREYPYMSDHDGANYTYVKFKKSNDKCSLLTNSMIDTRYEEIKKALDKLPTAEKINSIWLHYGTKISFTDKRLEAYGITSENIGEHSECVPQEQYCYLGQLFDSEKDPNKIIERLKKYPMDDWYISDDVMNEVRMYQDELYSYFDDDDKKIKLVYNGKLTEQSGKPLCQLEYDTFCSLKKKLDDILNGITLKYKALYDGFSNASARAKKLGASEEQQKTIDEYENKAKNSLENVQNLFDAYLDDYVKHIDPQKGISNNECAILSDDFKGFLDIILWYIRIAGVALAIILSLIDYIKAAAGSDEKSMASANKNMVTRIMLVAVLFLIPAILSFILNAFNISTTAGSIECIETSKNEIK